MTNRAWPYRSLGVFHPVAQHRDRTLRPAGASLLLPGLRDPLRVLLAMREREPVEDPAGARIRGQRAREGLRDLDLAGRVVALDLDLDLVPLHDPARGVADLLPEAEVGDAAVDHQPAAERRAVHGSGDRRSRAAELGLRIARHHDAAVAHRGFEAHR